MCGITGIIGPEIKREKVEQAAHRQRHRGPDHFGCVSGASYCFCHNRLSIIDLSAAANQPLENERGILVFNGEIYNFRELSGQLFGNPSPTSDTRVLMELLQNRGAPILPELDGMFAFCLYDKTTGVALLARDRLGIKPLYYAEYGETFMFASEIKTLLELLEKCTSYRRDNDLNRAYVDECIACGHAESGNLPFKTIRELHPGTSMSVSLMRKERCITTPFFSIPATIADSQHAGPDSVAAAVSRLDELLNRSVEMHLIADAPVGILCSGGVDSSLVTAMAARVNPSVAIYHAAIDGERGELDFAQAVAGRYRLELAAIHMNAETYLSSLPDTIWHLDQPMYHPSDVSLFAIAQRAHADGIKALLCGEGADELFGGYGWHVNFARTLRTWRQTSKIGSLVNTFHRAVKTFRYADKFSPEEYFRYSGNYLTYTADNVIAAAKRTSLLRDRSSWELLAQLRTAYTGRDTTPELAALVTSNLYGHLSTLLQRNDRMCMMAGIESRVPFLENRVIDFALALDSSFKIRGKCGKYLLKKCAEAYLPRSVIYRKKAGFPVPWKKYLATADKALLLDGFCAHHLGARRDDMEFMTSHDPDLLYTLLATEIWGRLFVQRETPESIRSALLRDASCRG
jgi:asparagine synthase (glutamine-hydrolysing)